MTIQPIYQTNWESLPVSLRPVELTTTEKVCRVAWNIISVIIPLIGLFRLAAYGLGLLAHRVILPAAYHNEDLKNFCRAQFNSQCRGVSHRFEVTPHTVVTPDGAALSVHLFRSYNANEQTPTTIYFGGNGALKGMGGWEWVLQDSINKNIPMNLVLLDYRSVDQSSGKFTGTKDLLVDGSSVVQWVRDTIRTPDHRIHFYGMSLGGAVALKTKAADERLTGDLLHERSFSSLEDCANELGVRLRWFLKPLVPLAISLLKNQGLELDAVSDVAKLKGRKLVVYHPHDPIIPYTASMARKVPGHCFLLHGPFGGNHHCAPLSDYDGARETVSNFIFAG